MMPLPAMELETMVAVAVTAPLNMGANLKVKLLLLFGCTVVSVKLEQLNTASLKAMPVMTNGSLPMFLTDIL